VVFIVVGFIHVCGIKQRRGWSAFFVKKPRVIPFFYRNGDIDFTVPMFDDFLRRHMSSLGTDLWGQNKVPEFPVPD